MVPSRRCSCRYPSAVCSAAVYCSQDGNCTLTFVTGFVTVLTTTLSFSLHVKFSVSYDRIVMSGTYDVCSSVWSILRDYEHVKTIVVHRSITQVAKYYVISLGFPYQVFPMTDDFLSSISIITQNTQRDVCMYGNQS